MTVKAVNEPTEEQAHLASDEVFVFPASFAQQRLWFLDKLEPGLNTYNVPFAMQLTGALNVPALEQALQEVVQRHESLRTTFAEDESGKPIQLVATEPQLAWAVSDLRCFPAESREHEARRQVIEHVRLPFDLKRGPLFRAKLLRLTDEEYVFCLAFHHIIVDGWSWGVVFRELSALYDSFDRGQPSPLAPLPIQYGDYASWQQDWLQGERLESLLAYWKKQLSDAPSVLELPGDFARPAIQTFGGAQEATIVPRPLQDALNELSQKEGATLFMTLLAAFNLLLARYSGQEDIVVGTPISGRTRSELEGLIGFLVNTLPLRTDVSGNPTFRQLIARVRETALQAYAHQDLPFERLVEELSPERDLSRSPVVQVLYIFENSTAKQNSRMGNLEVAPFRGAEGTTAKFDMQFSALVNPDGLRLALTYNVDLFRPATVQRMFAHLRTILDAMVANPDAHVGNLCLLSDAEREEVLTGFNGTHKDYRGSASVHQLVEAQVERTPEAIAVCYGDETLTYAELNKRSNQLAHHLATLGVSCGSLVAICMERSIEMIVSVLAVLKAGAAYVPLDPEYPKDRLAFMLEDSQAAVVLTQERLRSDLDLGSVRALCVDLAWNEISAQKAENLPPTAGPEDLVYVIYTSGSTGKPKGVCLPHRCLTNLLYWQMENSSAGGGDGTLQFTSLSFDVSFQEIFSTITSGGSLVLVSESTRRDGRALLHYLKDHAIVRLFQPFVALQQLAEAAHEEEILPTSLREVITAGEQLKITQQIASLFQRLPGCRLFNHYGPSETHVVTSYELPRDYSSWETLPPIGKPIANTQIYILDTNLNPVPLGVSGELYIGGVSLANGYLRRPDLTEQRFVSNPFSNDPSDRLYKTGDLGRYLPDGNIQYLGRIDNQVKFRGYRIELGEIESALAKHPEVAQAAVILREDIPGDKRLVAYVVPRNGSLDPQALRAFLKQSLPEYMVPSATVSMTALPLTPSGKVSRRNLPAPDWDTTSSQATAPRNPVEELLWGVWSVILRRKAFGIHDNFFELGGHSLLATQLVSRIRKTLQVDLPLRVVFEHPTIAELAQDVDRARGSARSEHSPRLVRRARSSSVALPLSFAEQRLWMLDRLDPNGSVYNLSVGLRLKGNLRVDALEQSLTEILRRHEVLRASFRLNGDEPEQIIAPPQPVSLTIADVSRDDSPEAAAREFARQESRRPFNLADGPLWRANVVKVAANDHVLLVNIHHAVFDGWSRGVLIRELAGHYTSLVNGSPAQLPELEIQYPDFAIWQREYLTGKRLDEQVGYWRQQLDGAPGNIELPTDRPRPQVQTFRGAHLSLTIPAALATKLKELSHKIDATLFMTLLSAFGVLLSRYSSQDDVVIGSPIAGRTYAETENLIGFFVNTIPLRTSIAGNPTFRQLLASVRATTLDAYAHQDLPFEKLVEELKPERDLSRNPIFQVMFALQNVPREDMELPELQVSPFRAGNAVNSKFDLSLITSETPDSIIATFEYNTDLFDSARIERMQRHWLRLLEAIVTDPDCPVAELPLLEEAERQLLLVDWNIEAGLSPSMLLHQFVEQQVERTPGAVALIDGTEQVAYSELNARANQLARKLRKLGVGPEVLVAVCTERCADMIVALLAVLKAGGAYVPLDPMYPKDRLAKILEDSRAKVMITQEQLTSILPPHSAEIVLLDRDWPMIAPESEANLDVAVTADNLAYVLFTSGSTGRPKGVALEHRSASIFVQWAQTVFTPEELSGTLFGTSICFDLSIFEMFVPLSVGGTVIIAQNALALKELPAANQVRLINTVPSAIAELLRMNAVPSCVLTINLAGEALPETLAREIYQQTSVCKLYNLYGPTEDTTYSTYTLVPHSGEVTIGRPIENTQAYILDSRRQPTPIGVPGELYLAGDGLARGYYGRDDLTAERFVQNPFSQQPNARMYRTGDRCRYRADGTIEYLGRIDNQVKLRGFRIELGEIEAVLNQHALVRQSLAMVREDLPGNPQLVAYVVTTSSGPDLPAQLRKRLSDSVPNYMVPSAIVQLEGFPLTPNGKIDRRALPAPDGTTQIETRFVAPRNETEKALAAIWAEVLRRPNIGVHDDFFALGGHSLLATQVISRIQTRLQRELPLRAAFEHTTVEQLARALDETAVKAAPKAKIGSVDRAAFRAKKR